MASEEERERHSRRRKLARLKDVRTRPPKMVEGKDLVKETYKRERLDVRDLSKYIEYEE